MRSAPLRLRERLARAVSHSVVGRDVELATLERQLDAAGPIVVFVHGIGGIGKTTLLDALEPRLVARGARVLRLDGRAIEPTPAGFLGALADALGVDGLADADAAAATIAAHAGPTSILVDEIDRLRLLDSWLRRTLLPALPETTRWVFVGRFAPRHEWLTAPGWSAAVESIRLAELDHDAARALLARRGVSDDTAPALVRLARGNPLALELAATRATSSSSTEPLNETMVLDLLAQRCVEDLPPHLRDAIDAACLVRRSTRPLLEAMLERPVEDALLAELTELPFIEYTEEGLAVHDAIRHAIAARIRALDPVRYARLREAAWRELDRQLDRTAPTGPNAWRLTADVLFVVDHPQIREAFFPSHESDYGVDSAVPEDEAVVHAIARAHEPPAVAAAIAQWWRLLPSSFRIARDRDGNAGGFALVAASHQVPAELRDRDDLLRQWHADVESGPGRHRGALYMRGALAVGDPERAREIRTALWLDVKRAYVERPAQWALYLATGRDSALLPLIEQFGFRRSPIVNEHERTLILEFGAAGIWTWLRNVIGGKHVATGEPPPSLGFHLDVTARGLVVDGQDLALSALEYGVLHYLQSAAGAVVTREVLLEQVWKQRHTGSNVVDAVVRLLRKKLGPYAHALETVKGHGYRLVAASSATTSSKSKS